MLGSDGVVAVSAQPEAAQLRCADFFGGASCAPGFSSDGWGAGAGPGSVGIHVHPPWLLHSVAPPSVEHCVASPKQ